VLEPVAGEFMNGNWKFTQPRLLNPFSSSNQRRDRERDYSYNRLERETDREERYNYEHSKQPDRQSENNDQVVND